MTKTELEILPHMNDDIFLDLFNCIISEDSFLARFEGSTLDYASLSGHANTTDSWQKQFDQWKADGILN